MHTVVFGWFGVSVIWLAPLVIRLAIAALTRDVDARGRGTIRLWLGFIGVFIGSGALEAALAPQTGNALGHALLGLATRTLGRGAFFLLPVLVLASLPWLIGFRWRDVLRWADRTFGLGLNLRPGASSSPSSVAAAGGRSDEPRLARGLGSGVVRTSTSAVNAMAPKPTGRYARPTPWQPPPVSTHTIKMRAGAPSPGANPHDARAAGGKAFDPLTSGHGAQRPTSWSVGDAARSGRTGRPAVGISVPPGGAHSANGQQAKGLQSVRSDPARARSIAAQPRPTAGLASHDGAYAASRTPPANARPTPASLPQFTPSVGRQGEAGSAAQARLTARPSITQVPRVAPVDAAGHASPIVEPTPGVLETLRAIEANAAQWTALAGSSLARRGTTPLKQPSPDTAAPVVPNAPTGSGEAAAPGKAPFASAGPTEQPHTPEAAPGLPPCDEPPGDGAFEPRAAATTEPGLGLAENAPGRRAAGDTTEASGNEHNETSSASAPTPPWADDDEPTARAEPRTAAPSAMTPAADAAATPHEAPPVGLTPPPATAPLTAPVLLELPSIPEPTREPATPVAPASPAAPACAPPSEDQAAGPLAAPEFDQPAAPAEATTPSVAPRTPVRGHAGAEFTFHAPAASAVELPSLYLLEPASTETEEIPAERLAQTSQLIEQRLQEFKVPVTVVGASAGPVITRFEIEPALGVRGSQIVGLMKDLSRGLGLTSIRVVETIPGKTCMGLELPNAKRQTIRLSEILAAAPYRNSASQLTLAMGKDITGHPIVTDLAKAPHMLVAGTTGSGKSVAINAMIVSLLFKATPEEVRLIMIDPKMLELSVYEGIPHLLAPVVTDMKLAANALNWCVGEMEKRYRLMSAVGVRNLAGFNQKLRDAQAAGKKIGNPFSLTPEAPEPLSPLPLIVVVIDELADLMMVAGKKIEELIARLAQKARAAGIHLILATQRPSVDVITGLIKANIPTRVAFQVSSKIDSRTILDQMGAESLLGQGDMLFLPPGTGYPQRVHGAFVADDEVHRVVEYLKQFGEPEYEEGILDGPATEGAAQDLFGDAPDAEADPLYDEAVAFVVRTRRASISAVQRQLRIGYNRAARLVEQMEAAGLVSSMGINGTREVLAPPSGEP